MAATTAFAIASLAVTAAGGYMTYRGQREQAKTAERASEFNARVKEQEAIQDDMDARENIRRTRRHNESVKARQRAKFAASGVLSSAGSPLEVLGQQAGILELNAFDQSRAAEIRRRRFGAEASNIRSEGAAVASGFRRSATGTILSTGAQLAGSGFDFRQSGAL